MRVWLVLVAAAAVATAACYKPAPTECAYQCNAESGCPAGLACTGGFCIEPGSSTVCAGGDADPDGPGDDADPDAPIASRLYRAVTVGSHHACAIDTMGRLWCWGLNDDRRLGVMTGDDYSAVPLHVLPTMTGGEWTDISAGANHTCGLWTPTAAATELWCWGQNYNYQTGQTGSNPAPHQVPTPTNHRWKSLALGGAHSCAILEDTTTTNDVIMCWGDNTLSQLGVTGVGMRANVMPIDTSAVSPATTRWRSLTSGTDHSCALAMDGKAYCWGDNGSGQGGATPGGTGDRARAVQGGFLWDSIAAGDDFTCAIDMPTKVPRCWGRNGSRELGNGGTTITGMPTALIDAGTTPRWKALGLGLYSACGIQGTASSTDAIGTVRCWGDNDFGQRGDGTFDTPTDGPVFGVLNQAYAVDSGHEFACALEGDPVNGGSLHCWGDNADGQLGTGSASDQRKPVRVGEGVRGTRTWIAVAAGRRHTCAILSGATPDLQELYCWGAGMSGQIDGVVAAVPRRVPMRVTLANGATHVSVGSSHTCARRVSATQATSVLCWGSDQGYQLGVAGNQEPGPATPYGVGSTITPVKVFGAGNVTCIYGGATTQCWGSPEITTPYYVDNDTPWTVQFGGGETPSVDFSPGPNSACWVANNSVRCFGGNSFGQMGWGMASTPASQPQPVFGLSDVNKLSFGPSNHRCAIHSDRTVQCWGANGYNQAGVADGMDKIAPVTIMAPNQYDEVRTGLNHTCALDGGTVYCWGNNDQFQRTSVATFNSLPPMPIVAPMGESMPAFTQLVSGEFHNCAISNAGILYCWGASRWGQVGAGAANEASAVRVVDGTP